MHQAWLKDQKGLLNDRRQWLAYREMLGRQASQLPMDEQVILEEVGISSWTTFQEMHIDPQRPTRMKLLFSILHRFMSLSSEIAPIMGNINSNWMDLALQVMLQTALEILCGDDGHQANTASDTANTAHEKERGCSWTNRMLRFWLPPQRCEPSRHLRRRTFHQRHVLKHFS